jgi:hypothetical protein
VRRHGATSADVCTRLVSQSEEWPNGGRQPRQIHHSLSRGPLPCLHAQREQEPRYSALSLRSFAVRTIGDMIPLLHPCHQSEDGLHGIRA